MRRLVFIVLSIAVSAIFLYFVLRDVPLAEVWEQLQTAQVGWVLIAFISATLGLWIRAWRWRDLLGYKIGQRDAFYIIGITFLLNQFPLRAGEVARSFLARRHDVPVVTAATSIVVERLLDTVLVVLLLTAALANVPNVPAEVNQTASLFGVLALVGFIVLLAFARFPYVPRAILRTLFRIIPLLQRLPLMSMLDNVLTGLEPITHPRRLISAVGLTLLSWVFSFGVLGSLHFALDVTDVNLIISTALGLSLASFSVAIPVSVAAIGPFEAALFLTGQMVNMPEVQAIALGFLFHGLSVLNYIVWGVVGFLALGVSMSDLQSKDDDVMDTAG
jgi:uncharacterized membrane protein YbhN (UPF0104 family)